MLVGRELDNVASQFGEGPLARYSSNAATTPTAAATVWGAAASATAATAAAGHSRISATAAEKVRIPSPHNGERSRAEFLQQSAPRMTAAVHTHPWRQAVATKHVAPIICA